MKNACNLFKANCAQLLKKKREFPLFSAQKFIVKFVVKNKQRLMWTSEIQGPKGVQ